MEEKSQYIYDCYSFGAYLSRDAYEKLWVIRIFKKAGFLCNFYKMLGGLEIIKKLGKFLKNLEFWKFYFNWKMIWNDED